MHTTAKEAMSQPLFFVVLALGIFALLMFPFIPYNTLGEDIKMLKEVGLDLIPVPGDYRRALDGFYFHRRRD